MKNNKTIKLSLFDKIYCFYVFLYANIFISPLLTLPPLPIWKSLTLLTAGLLFSVICLLIKSKKLISNRSKIPLAVFVVVIILSSMTGIYYCSYLPFYENFSFLLILLAMAFFTGKHGRIFVDISTAFICLLVLGAYIGVVYAFLGGKPVFSFPNGDGRLNSVYLTTGTNFSIGRFIRPSGIYDEPGALSFFICGVCLLRVFFNRNDDFTFLILISGIITSSLAHLLILTCFAVYYVRRYRKKKSTFVFVLVFFAAGLIVIMLFYELFDTLLFNRLRYNSSAGRLSGDTRSHLFLNALELVDAKSFFWGLDKTVYVDKDLFNLRFPLIGDNPLTPLVKYGIFSQWYYYFMLSVIFVAGLFHKRYFFIYLSVCLLFFQRSNPHVISYNFYFTLFFLIAMETIKENRNKISMFIKKPLPAS